jgi:hypothetical protein
MMPRIRVVDMIMPAGCAVYWRIMELVAGLQQPLIETMPPNAT